MRYIKKPEVVEAEQFNQARKELPFEDAGVLQFDTAIGYYISTPEGSQTLEDGDWLIKNGQSYYICSAEDFEAKYALEASPESEPEEEPEQKDEPEPEPKKKSQPRKKK